MTSSRTTGELRAVRAAQLEPTHLRGLMELCSAVLVREDDGTVVMANDPACLLLAKPRVEILGQAIDELILFEAQALSSDAPRSGKVRHIDRWIEAQGSPAQLSDGRYLTVEILTDISARQALEATSTSKNMFLARLSHELRTPLSAVIGYAELLREDVREGDAAGDDLDRILAASQHMLSMISSLADLARIEAGRIKLELRYFSLRQLADEIVGLIEPSIRAKGNTLELDWPSHLGALCTDRTKLRQILINLLSNANKFTDQGTIALMCRHHGELVSFVVRDEGRGIAPELLSTIFESFTQEHGNRYGGMGLGLAISQGFALALGGRIQVESALGQGSTFTVTLPTYRNEPMLDDSSNLDEDVSTIMPEL